jgi:hypothetical protein
MDSACCGSNEIPNAFMSSPTSCAPERARALSARATSSPGSKTSPLARGTRFRLAIEYPEAFPYVAPRAFIVRPTILTAPHRLTDGALCLFPNPTLADAPKTSAYVVRNRAVIWFLGYEDWKRTGTWRASEH